MSSVSFGYCLFLGIGAIFANSGLASNAAAGFSGGQSAAVPVVWSGSQLGKLVLKFVWLSSIAGPLSFDSLVTVLILIKPSW